MVKGLISNKCIISHLTKLKHISI